MLDRPAQNVTELVIEIFANSDYCRIATNIGDIVGRYSQGKHTNDSEVGIQRFKNDALFNIIFEYLNNCPLSTNSAQLSVQRNYTTIVINNKLKGTNISIPYDRFYSYLSNLFAYMLDKNVIDRNTLHKLTKTNPYILLNLQGNSCMKTKIFNIWTPLVETYLHAISTPTTSYETLSNWMDTEGCKLFQLAQAQYYHEHKSNYLQDSGPLLPPGYLSLAYEQIAYAFNKIHEALIQQFGDVKALADLKFPNFIKQCLAEKYMPFIAARAVISYQVEKANQPDKLKNLESVVDAFELLTQASQASIDSINEFRQKLPSVPRESSSPAMYKTPQQTNLTSTTVETISNTIRK